MGSLLDCYEAFYKGVLTIAGHFSCSEDQDICQRIRTLAYDPNRPLKIKQDATRALAR